MENAQSDSTIAEKKEETKGTSDHPEEWIKHHSWLLAIIAGSASLLILLAPWFKIDKAMVSLWDCFGNPYRMPWGIAVAMGLSLLGIVFACFPRKSRLLVVSMFAFIVASLFDIIGKDFFVLVNSSVAADDVSLYFGLIMACCFNAIAALFSYNASSDVDSFSVKDMVECAVLVAAAEALSFGRLLKIGAGSVNLQMLPLFLLALRYGPSKAFLMCGVIFGLITCATDGYGFQCYPFDYLVGFGSVAILGFFSKEIFVPGQKGYSLKGEAFLFLGCLLSTALRFLAGSVSGTILWETPFVDSMIGNISYIGISGAIATVAVMACYGPLTSLNSRFPTKEKIAE
jgi:thiamine transporter ThiT